MAQHLPLTSRISTRALIACGLPAASWAPAQSAHGSGGWFGVAKTSDPLGRVTRTAVASPRVTTWVAAVATRDGSTIMATASAAACNCWQSALTEVRALVAARSRRCSDRL